MDGMGIWKKACGVRYSGLSNAVGHGHFQNRIEVFVSGNQSWDDEIWNETWANGDGSREKASTAANYSIVPHQREMKDFSVSELVAVSEDGNITPPRRLAADRLLRWLGATISETMGSYRKISWPNGIPSSAML
jgi:hypothetical protein